MHASLPNAGCLVETPDGRSHRGLIWSRHDTPTPGVDQESMHRPALVTGVLLLGAVSCRDRQPTAPLDAILSNERVLLPDGDRRFDAERLPVVWLEEAGEQVSLRYETRSESHPLTHHAERRDAAGIYRVDREPPSAGNGRLCAASGQAERCWSVEWAPPPAERPAVAALPTEPIQALERAVAALSGEDRLWGSGEYARALRRSGQTAEAADAWRAAADVAERLGWTGEVARCLRNAAFHEYLLGRFDRARAMLTRVEGLGEGSTASRRLTAYYQALVEYGLSRFQAATRRLEALARDAWSAGDDTLSSFVAETLALAYIDQGRLEEARALLFDPRLEAIIAARRPAERAAYLNNRGWLLLHSHQRGAAEAGALDEARAAFEGALAVLGESTTSGWARVNLTWSLLLAGELDRAAAAAPMSSTATDIESALVVGELHLRRGELTAAHEAFTTALRLAESSSGRLPTDTTWRAHYGLGRVAAARGDTPAALTAWRAALTALDAVADQTGVWHARSRFYADRRPLIEDTARLLIASGDIDGAFAVLDHAHGRALRSLEARTRLDRLPAEVRAEWERHQSAFATARAAFDAGHDGGDLLDAAGKARWTAEREALEAEMIAAFEAADALLAREAPRRAPDAVDVDALRAALPARTALVSYALVGDAVHAFWLDAAGITHAIAPRDALLAPFGDRLAALDHLYVVPGEVREARELATVVIDGAPLGTRLSLSDLPYAALLTRRAPRVDGPLLVIADPRIDLPHALTEGRALAAATPGARLLAHDDADRAAVRAAMAAAGAMHYAGHGVARAATPWQAHLALADDTRLTVADILTGAVPPGTVVLSGCRTGVQNALSASEAIGLADAFVAAGAGAVLATRETVPDEAAARFVARFHAEGGLDRPGLALRTTAAAFARAGDPIWTAFRLTGHP